MVRTNCPTKRPRYGFPCARHVSEIRWVSLVFCATVLGVGASGLGGQAANVCSACDNPVSAWTGTIGPAPTLFDLGVDSSGSTFVAGVYFDAVDFDPTDGVDERIASGGGDIFATKLHPDGSYAWTYAVGGPNGWDAAKGVDVDPSGSTLVAGAFQGTVDFDPTSGVDEHTAIGDFNVFLSKLTCEGTYVGTFTLGQGDERVGPNDLAVDGEGNLLIAGAFLGSADFDPTAGVDNRTSAGYDIFVTKLAPDGAYLWTGTMGGAGYDVGTGIGVDSGGNIFVTGTFRGTADFDPGPGVDEHTMIPPYEDVFITKLHPDGSYAWTRTYDPWLPFQGGPIAVDSAGAALITGAFQGTVDFDPTKGIDLRTSVAGTGDIFVTKLHGNASYAWTYTVGGLASDIGADVALDAAGSVFVTGEFWETVDFDPGAGLDQYTSGGRQDVFVTMLRSDGSYGWTRTVGGTFTEIGTHVGTAPEGALVAAGYFGTLPSLPVDFDPGCEVDARIPHVEEYADTFITKLICVDPTGDFDDDGDVDLLDFARFQVCFTGEGPAVCRGGCNRFDLDPDDDIDLFDFAAFTALLNGPSP